MKQAPTACKFSLFEKTSSKIWFRTITKNSDVPFCDSFMIEMEGLVLGPDKPNASCCIIRMTQQIIWLKFCMMKAMIRSSSDSETKIAMGMWDDIFTKAGMAFVEPHLRKAKVIVREETIETAIEETKGDQAPE